MNIELEPGKYVVAVSGGVDSVSLLHLLGELQDIELVVAHFDHGIREESAEDRQFVGALAEQSSLPFFYDEGRLGADASEATARRVRYEFLEKTRRDQNAIAVLTAHHADDVLETAIINILRGTGRKGLSSLGSQPHVARPLTQISKQEILAYARQSDLEWRDDRSNDDTAYLRNYVRHQLLDKFSEQDKRRLAEIVAEAGERNQMIDTLLVKYLPTTSDNSVLERQLFTRLPHDVAREVLAAWLRAHNLRDFDKKTLERLVVTAKTGRPGSRFDVMKGCYLAITKNHLALEPSERWKKIPTEV